MLWIESVECLYEALQKQSAELFRRSAEQEILSAELFRRSAELFRPPDGGGRGTRRVLEQESVLKTKKTMFFHPKKGKLHKL